MSYKKINETTVYKLAFDLAMKIFEVAKRFPKEETYSLTDQIRRSSRSVCACLAEAHIKRLYKAYFVFESIGCRYGKYGNSNMAAICQCL